MLFLCSTLNQDSVQSYHPSEAKIVLRDKYPATTTTVPTAVVSIENILEDINHDLLQTGCWLNVVGYVRMPPVDAARRSKSSKDVSKPKEASQQTIVEATMMWSAGAIKLDMYKSATQEYQNLHSAR